jgi:hypothetical protein
MADFDLALINDLFKIADNLQCPTIERQISANVSKRAGEDPWGIFRVASQRDDIVLAKAAIKCMGDCDNPGQSLSSLRRQDIAGITSSYLLGLYSCRLSSATMYAGSWHASHEQAQSCYRLEEWKAAANNFNPR